ncbi:hypothetical protein O1C60_003478 [Vibrio cholerae]|nr:hypothetical protein [Vibrio cholerae]EKF9648208.1 hypothetical protein [Vibrio cholerae]EKF9652165.1 hypothetical protein [Vibrio cholerae]
MRVFRLLVLCVFSSGAFASQIDWFQVGACIYNDIYLLGMDKAKEKHGELDFNLLSKEDSFEVGTGFGNRQATLLSQLQSKGQEHTMTQATHYADIRCFKIVGFKANE